VPTNSASSTASAQIRTNQPWSLNSWATHHIMQQPIYSDKAELKRVLKEIENKPPLVSEGEIENLKKQLADANLGKKFLLQAGDCAERFEDCNAQNIADKLKIILQMSLVLIHGLRKPVIRVGRIAGQFAKPRSTEAETIDGITLPSYRGDIINDFPFNKESRTPQPKKLLEAYYSSCTTLNYLRCLIDGGFADVRHPEMWNLEHISNKAEKNKVLYHQIQERLKQVTEFLDLFGGSQVEALRRVDFFASHEALLLDYETALTRKIGNLYYNLGAHFVWLGERTRKIDSAHVEYLRGIENPIGVKIGPSANLPELIEILCKLNPEKKEGKIVGITRFGAQKAQAELERIAPTLIRECPWMVWCCDPMHGNTIRVNEGIKTRLFTEILEEIKVSYRTLLKCGTHLGGVHFELTGNDVTECVGGTYGVEENRLSENYQTSCDPRLNYSQSMEIAYLISDLFNTGKNIG
jgi:3-deoxy-7-phosphoheptulonate synthase